MYEDSQEFKRLVNVFKNAEQRVNNILLKTRANNVKEFSVKINSQLNKVELELRNNIAKWGARDLPNSYKEGVNLVDNKVNNILPKSNLNGNVVLNSYIELAQNTNIATSNVREIVNKAINDVESGGGVATVNKVKNFIKDTLLKENNNAMHVTYANGNKVNLTSYSQMLARTSRISTANGGIVDRCKDIGIDLVRCTTIGSTCPICKKYEGKVYSISGYSDKYPPLYNTNNSPFKNGYNIIHPNCRHEFLPFQEQFYTDKELKDIQKESNDFKDFTGKEKIFDTYKDNQSRMKQYREEYNEYKSIKQQLGNDNPYTTIGGYRRAKRSNADTFKAVIKKYNKVIKQTPKTDIITNEDRDVITLYTSINVHEEINSYLWNKRNKDIFNDDNLPEKYKKIIKDLDSALVKLPKYKGTTYRSVQLTKKQIAEYEIGKTTTMYGYTSTTTDNERYSNSRNVEFIVNGKNGRSVEVISDFKTEKEILFKRNATFRITNKVLFKDKYNRDITYIYLKEY